MSLIIQFGAFPKLSLAELVARAPSATNGHLVAGRFYVTNAPLSPAWLMGQLGGVVKILEVIQNGGAPDPTQLAHHILDTSTAKNKVSFGVSNINAPEFAGLGIAIKRAIQEISDRPVRAVTSREKELSSVSVQLEKLLPPDGVELVLIKDSSQLIIAQTVSAQSFDEWSFRDYHRPGRNAKRGMIPPKLAKIMINLALGDSEPQTKTFYDPFCGSGTILAEAALLDIGRVLGSDIATQAVTDSKALIKWASQQFSIEQTHFDIFKHDATSLTGHIKPYSIDMIVTETFLGRPLKTGESLNNREKLDLVVLYNRALRALAPLLKPRGRLVLVLPFQTKPQQFLPLDEILDGTSLVLAAEPLLYARDDQRTGRQIVQLR